MTDRVDKKKNVAKVAKEVLQDPLQTVREISDKTWVSKSTAATHKNNLDKVGQKDPRIVGVTDKDIDIVSIAQDILLDRLQDEEKREKIKAIDVATIAEKSHKRYTIFRGEVTDEHGGMKQPAISQEQKEALDSLFWL